MPILRGEKQETTKLCAFMTLLNIYANEVVSLDWGFALLCVTFPGPSNMHPSPPFPALLLALLLSLALSLSLLLSLDQGFLNIRVRLVQGPTHWGPNPDTGLWMLL